jgi:hypothetical protein
MTFLTDLIGKKEVRDIFDFLLSRFVQSSFDPPEMLGFAGITQWPLVLPFLSILIPLSDSAYS